MRNVSTNNLKFHGLAFKLDRSNLAAVQFMASVGADALKGM